MQHGLWIRVLAACAATVTVVGVATPAFARAATPPPSTSAPSVLGTVTLITGDRVEVARESDGTHLATLLPGYTAHSAVKVVERGEDVYVIPLEAQPYVAAGSLDRELFNVTGLLDGDGDGSGDGSVSDSSDGASLPLIVAQKNRRVPAHSVRRAALESIGAQAVTVPLNEAEQFWAGIKAGIDSGATKVWRDPVLEADLAESVPQIGAPTAWAAGFDGAGTTVAVLDTGYDPTHPSLAGKVKGSTDFSGTGIVDGHGHGTHVASTVAGVAPKADLLVGKVMNNGGEGMGSWLIDGMEWAVAAGADVVNMSLSTEVTDGTDPLSQAVNALSAASGTLFVATSGNTGPGELTARAPGNADAALSVAAVDKSGVLAPFSSRGPRSGDYAIKPDIAAPGVDIVAARAKGTALGTPVGDLYTKASGTSMAAPHVAGAAAILKQRHPGWTGDRLKAALMGSAADVAGAGVYEVGAGRVDVARAVTQAVTASPGSVSFGRYAWSDQPRDPVTRTIVYRNSGGRDLTLALTVQAGPPGMFGLDKTSVTVPAGGEAAVRLTLDPNKGDTIRYGGSVLATTEDGTVVHTPVGVVKEPRMVQLTVEGIAQDGTPAGRSSLADLWNLDTGAWVERAFGGKGGPGPAVFTVPVGTYSLAGFLWTLDGAGAFGLDVAVVSRPEFALTQDTRIVLDGRAGLKLNPITPQPAESRQITLGYYRTSGTREFNLHYLLDQYVDGVYAAPTEPVTRGEFELSTHWELAAPEFTMLLDRSTLRAEYSIGSPRIDGRKAYRMVDAGRGRPEDVAGRDLTGRLALVAFSADRSIADQVQTVGEAGAVAAIVYHDQPGLLLGRVPAGSPIPSFTVEQAPGRELLAAAARGTRLQITGTPHSPYVYDLFPYFPGRVPAAVDRRVEHRTLARTAATYNGAGSNQRGAEILFPRRPYDSFVLRQAQQLAIPSTRVEWATPGGVVWRPLTWRTTDLSGALVGSQRTYTPGQRRAEDWFRPVVRPGVPSIVDPDDAQWGIPGFRRGDEFTIQIYSMLDSGDHFAEGGGNPRARLYRDGALVAERARLEGTWPASARRASYRLELDVSQSAPWWRYATRTHTAWGFTSGRPAGGGQEFLDLLQIEYDVRTDLNGDVASGRPVEIGLRVHPQARPDRSTRATVRVWVSHDEGASWERVGRVVAHGGSHTAILKPAKRAGTVSLRVEAVAPNGASITQEIIRAFGTS